jgi:hypothetical protein
LEVAQLLAALTRAAHEHPRVHGALKDLLNSRLQQLLDQAADWSVTPIPSLLTEALQVAGTSDNP